MFVLKIIFLILNVKFTLQIVSDEIKDAVTDHSGVVFNRRILDNPADTYWPDPNGGGTGFKTRRNCMGETFDEVLRRYRKMLQNDGALVDFVSSDPLPTNLTNLDFNTCAVNYEEIKHLHSKKEDVPITFENGTSHKSIKTLKIENVTKPKNESSDEKIKFEYGTTPKNNKSDFSNKDSKNETINAATTDKPKAALKDGFKVRNLTEEKSRRASEYMFSSIEYYDDPEEFDESVCPDDIEVISLEIDQLRNYDVECEMIIEWRSLE